MMASVTRTPPAGNVPPPEAPRPTAPVAGPGGSPGASGPRGPGGARRGGRAGHFGAFRLQQLVLFEIAAALLLCAWVVDPLLLAPAVVVAGALVLLAVVRRRRRSLPVWLLTVLALRARTRRAASAVLPAGTEPGFAPAVECEPALRTYSFRDRDRRPVGMIGDGTYLTAVLRIDSDTTALRPDRSVRPLPLVLVKDALDVDGIRLESAQIVQHTQPAPAPHLSERSVAARNYAPLQARTGSPAVRITWVALKLDPELCPEAVRARGGGLTGAQKCLVRTVDQLSSRLTGAGFGATVLTEQELHSAIATSVGAGPEAVARAGRSGTPVRRAAETSRTWRCDDRLHTTYRVRRWPQFGAGGAPMLQLVALLTSVPASATTFSLTLGHADRQEIPITGHIRITGCGEEELIAARTELERTARGVKTSLVRLDREQLPGVLATLPLGGTH
ncbi:type VII secretion protein EccE [Streptomyces brevispora]|uniref:Type VII secretion protein EccE n=2 Tax=Streptomyces brevispora TaxID=887462 RepID=A0ABZ1FZD1_9ACTN|nr:type VII secretion protein EccE [Streptomyces brevispora]WSC12969.1 type VII secretion protein EccE [Streptomyces brevispora]